MSFVVDASVAVKWVVDEPRHLAAIEAVAGLPLVAPTFVLVEVSSILWKKVRTKSVARRQAIEGFQFVRTAFSDLLPDATLVETALQLALDLDHPIYDCLYVACALARHLPVLTDDRRLAELAGSSGRFEAKLLADAA